MTLYTIALKLEKHDESRWEPKYYIYTYKLC